MVDSVTGRKCRAHNRYEIINQADTLLRVLSVGRFNTREYTTEIEIGMGDDTWEPDVTRAVFSGARFTLDGSARIRWRPT